MKCINRFIQHLSLLTFCTLFSLHGQQLHIGLCVVATGKYIQFVKPLLDSAEKYFCPNHKKTYFIFTDSTAHGLQSLLNSSYKDNIVITYQKRLGWPYDTLMRFSIYSQNKHLFAQTDYMFATDADMLFVDTEGDEILGSRVATNHPGFEKNKPLWGNEPPYDRNEQSTAYIPYDQGTYYFAGGFYGGTTTEFIQMTDSLTNNILADIEQHNYIAVWHDESHLNRYFIDNPPSIILDRSYCYPENGEQKGYPACSPKLLALDKNHAEIRAEDNSYKGIPVLVTGGCGFIGSHLVEKLVALGADVSILDDLSTGSEANITAVADKITLIRGSITDLETCLMATHNKKIIFHLAACVSVPGSMENPHTCHDINVTGTQNLLEAAHRNGVERFVFSSTCAVYGNTTEQCTETTPPNPTSPYGFSKLIGELYCKEYAQIFDIETVAMRYFNVYGPRQNPQASYAGVIAKFMHNMEHNLPLTIFGDGTQTRDYVPVEKVVEANIFFGICEKKYIQAELFNIATGKSSNIFDIIDVLKQKYPAYNNETLFMPPRPGDVLHVAADCSKYNNLYNQIMNRSTITKECYV